MEAKEINIAAILKDKPKGTTLYDKLHNIEVELDNVSTTNGVTNIWCKRDLSNKTQHFGYSELGTERGWLEGLQILKPSNVMQDWSKFAWKKGDVLVNGCGFMCIFKEWATDDYTKFNGCYSNSRDGHEDVPNAETIKFNKVDHNTAYGYIREIEKKLGGIFNTLTLEIEKPQFKNGDIFTLDGNETYITTIGIFKGYNNEGRIKVYAAYNMDREIDYINVAAYDRTIRFATEEEKQQLFDALAKENKVWNPETKTLEDLPKKCEFKPMNPMDLCLMRDFGETWRLCQFGFMEEVYAKDYNAVGGNWYNECIPYNDQTAHLLGTTDDWKGGEA